MLFMIVVIFFGIASVIAVVSMSFFFQAEDGIRYLIGTGVQTCALPIFGRRPVQCLRRALRHWPDLDPQQPGDRTRSEGRGRSVRAPPREWRASLVHAAAGMR